MIITREREEMWSFPCLFVLFQMKGTLGAPATHNEKKNTEREKPCATLFLRQISTEEWERVKKGSERETRRERNKWCSCVSRGRHGIQQEGTTQTTEQKRKKSFSENEKIHSKSSRRKSWAYKKHSPSSPNEYSSIAYSHGYISFFRFIFVLFLLLQFN